ncbi:MAG TPA: transketolase C-terminal domain-containing protein, partial [Thermoanaerobaculia bacterium]|nr:transketolase C-terminal domain-containing protein [Thermoanaerobaculia bacterium]
YGMPGATLFGNDPDEIAAGVAWAAERARAGRGPALLELMTYRRTGHAHHDDDRFFGNPEAKIAGYEHEPERRRWEDVDPLALYEARLVEMGVATREQLAALRAEVQAEVDDAGRVAETAPWPSPDDYRHRVYAARVDPVPSPGAEPRTRTMAYDEAVRQAISEAMSADERVFVLGEDVGGRYGGAFGVTRGLAKTFGDARCVNMPIAESAIVGCAVGAAISGLRPVVEMQFADFLASGFNALVNNAARLHWRWGRAVPMVLRLPYGGATGTGQRLLGGGPYHSQCPEMWFLRTPGWKIVAPSTPADAKGLMLAAIRDNNPVVFLEAKGLYGFFRTDLREDVPLGAEHEVEIGRAAVRREGGDLTILTYGSMVWASLAAAERLAGEGIAAEVVDLRTLWPLDVDCVRASVEKTHRALVVHEDTRRGGLGGELAAILADELFWQLDAPLRRVTAPDTPVPYSPPLELDFLPDTDDVVTAARRLVAQ